MGQHWRASGAPEPATRLGLNTFTVARRFRRMNPIVPNWYADPEIHVFGGRYYLYPTTSAPYEEQTFFECWSSPDLAEWRNEGKILEFKEVPWSTNRAAWAPSCLEHGGKYYFYFSAGDGAGLGAAVSDSPVGPFVDALGRPLVKEYVHGAQPIDAHAFQDVDGTAYLYWGGHGKAVVARLSDDRVSLEGKVFDITPENYVEGPFMLNRGGLYYFMWSEGGWGEESYSVAYGISESPLGPFERVGVVLRSDPAVGTSAGHHSVLRLPGSNQHIIAYHRRPLGETDRHHRVVCLDYLDFDRNGAIKAVNLSFQGVARTPLELLPSP